jgi:hypothetical protein
MIGACRTHGRKEKFMEDIYVGKSERKKPLRKVWRRCGNNIKMHIKNRFLIEFIWLRI